MCELSLLFVQSLIRLTKSELPDTPVNHYIFIIRRPILFLMTPDVDLTSLYGTEFL